MTDAPKYLYDVAISFLSGDEPLALKLYEKLSEGLSVFLYSKKQEQLAGTDGLESFRQAFFSKSLLIVVLYRDGWGQTRWTAVEELAIKERMFNGGWHSLLFVMLDQQSKYPAWLPETHIRLDYTRFADNLVGASTLRVIELGGKLKIETALEKARRMEAVAKAQAERIQKLTYEAGAAVDNMKKVLKKGAVRLNPNFPASYALLIYNYISLNRLDEAKATYEQAVERKLKNPFFHHALYQIAFLQNDAAGMAQQVAQSAGTPGVENQLLGMEVDTAAYSGRLKEAREFSLRAVDSAAREQGGGASRNILRAVGSAGSLIRERRRGTTAYRFGDGSLGRPRCAVRHCAHLGLCKGRRASASANG